MKRKCKRKTRRGLIVAGAAILLLFGIWKLTLPEMYVTSALSQPQLRQMERQTAKMPCVIPKTTLLAQHMVCYEGPFLEDGSDEEVVDVAALSVKNIGSSGIEAAQIVLQMDNKLLTFNITNLPPGDTILVLEEKREKYVKGEYELYSGWQLEDDNTWITDKIRVVETDMAQLDVTNCSDCQISNVQIFYKNYLSDANVLIGGISNRVWLGTLQPGQTAEIKLPKYASGYSKVVCVKSG